MSRYYNKNKQNCGSVTMHYVSQYTPTCQFLDTKNSSFILSGQFLHAAHLDDYLNINTRKNEQMTMLCELIKHILLPTCDVSHL